MDFTKFTITVLVILLLTSAWPRSSLAQNADPICEGLVGAAFGQCTAAVAVGCDGTVEQATGCKKIAENFTRLTGTSPPWESGPCSCFTTNDVTTMIKAYLSDGNKVEFVHQATEIEDKFIILIDGFREHYVAAKNYKLGSGICSNFEIKLPIPLEEADSCIANMRIAASSTGIPTP